MLQLTLYPAVTTTLPNPASTHSMSYSNAFRDPNWYRAMLDEYNALIKNNTWVLVPRPPDANIVRSLWLFRHKHNADGSLNRYKARLVANGSTQIVGIDVDETFSPVVKPATIRTVLSFDISRHWPVHQLDVKNAFLHGMPLGPGFSDLQPMLLGLVFSTVDLCFSASLLPLYAILSLTDLARLITFWCSVTRITSGMFLFSTAVCLFMHDPREPHFSALKRILRYVRGTLTSGLQLYSSTTSSLVAYSDADWAGCPTTRRSTSGYCVFLGNNLLSWSSKQQFTLSRSSVEAEYRGVANAVAETCWLRNLLRELHTPLSTATIVYCDNVSAVYPNVVIQMVDINTTVLI
ncbi:ribonuclease H-like domain-containing protein [Tanacetum coccineum]